MIQTLYKNTNNTNTIVIDIVIVIDIEVSFVRGFQPPTILKTPLRGERKRIHVTSTSKKHSIVL
jgi:hypothetical protein